MRSITATYSAVTGYLSALFMRRLSYTRAYVCIIAVSFVFILPILLAGVDYIDDSARHVSGYYEWGLLGRYVTEAIVHILTFSGQTMPDMGHFMQILSVPILALGTLFFARAIEGRRAGVSILALLSALPIALNPFLLANMSFRYDSFSMILAYTLAIFAAVVAVQIDSTMRIRTRAAVSVLLLFLSAGLYQPMVLIYVPIVLAMLIVNSLYQTKKRDELLLPALKAAFYFALGLVAYYLTLKLFGFGAIGGEQRGQLLPASREGLEIVWQNFVSSWELAAAYTQNGAAKVLWIVLIFILLVGLSGLVMKTFRNSRSGLAAIALPLMPVVALFAIIGPFALMDSTITVQVRTISSAIGVILMASVVVFAVAKSGGRQIWVVGALALVIVSMYALNFSFVYGSALKNQREHDSAVYLDIQDKLLDRNITTHTVDSMLVGGYPSSPQSVERQLRSRPLMKKMDVAGNNSTWYTWTRLQDSMLVMNARWYTFTADQEALRAQVCNGERGQNIIGSLYYELYSYSASEYVLWLKDPQKPETRFCGAP